LALPPDELELETEELLFDELEEELGPPGLMLELELLDGATLLVELDAVPEDTEHSLVPPAILVPAPKVTSPQTKLPVRTL
jgi:hypothetical protein